MSLGWALRRLAAMPPAELAHRARIAARDRFAPPAWASWPPAEAGRRLFEGDPAAALARSPLRSLARIESLTADDVADTLAAARDLLAGRWRLFGREVALDDPPRWNRDPISGAEWPDLPSTRIDYRQGPGGPKPVWELGRLTFLPTLAVAARIGSGSEAAAPSSPAGGPAAAGRAARWLDDWTAHVPLGRGVHHTSGIEMAVRVLTASWTLALLDESGPRPALGPCLGLLAQQALHCRDHLSLGSSANNHLIAEYAAMAVMGAGFPPLRGADGLAATGLAGLEREVLRQIHPDGVPAEQAFGYLPFVWELALFALLAGEASGRTASGAVRERLRASLEFARAIRLPDGRWPRFGDEDDGRILLAGGDASRLDVVGNAVAAWLGAPALSDSDHGLALLLSGGRPPAARPAADGRLDFVDGGYTVWRGSGLHVAFDHGPLGLPPIAAHGHADALSLTVTRHTDEIVIDPGTLAYQEDAAARDRCRGTPAHATIHFAGGSQSRMIGPFLWADRARVVAEGAGWECVWADGGRHHRGVAVAGDRITISDRVRGTGAEIVFPLAPGAAVETSGTRAVVTSGSSRATFESDGLDEWRVEAAEAAPGYGRRLPSPRLTASLRGGEARTTLTVGGL